MAKKKTKIWKQVTGEGEYICDQCNKDTTPRCGECGHVAEERPKVYSNGSYYLCDDCYSLTLTQWYDGC